MNTFLFRVSVFSLSLLALQASGAADGLSQKFRDQPPYFYAVIAKAAYKHHLESVQAVLDKKLGAGEATVLDHVDYHSTFYGHTNIILVSDKKNRLHVGIEGTSEGRNWIGNAKTIFKGSPDADVKTYIHNIIKDWEKWRPGSTLVSIVGHSQGGTLASHIVRAHETHYTKPLKTKSGKIDRSKRQGRTNVITFNCLKPRGNQFHFAISKEFAATLLSSRGRYIPIYEGNDNPASVLSNHSMKYVIRGLRDKTWEDFRRYNNHIQ